MGWKLGICPVLLLGVLGLSACALIAPSPPPPTFAPVAPPPAAPGNDPNAPDLRVTIAEKYAIRQMLISTRNDPSLQNPTLDLTPPNRIRASATVVAAVPASVPLLGGQKVSVRPIVQMHLEVANNRVLVAIDSVDLGGVSIPLTAIQTQLNQIKKQVEDQANETIQRSVAGTNLKLSAVSTTDDSLILDFRE